LPRNRTVVPVGALNGGRIPAIAMASVNRRRKGFTRRVYGL